MLHRNRLAHVLLVAVLLVSLGFSPFSWAWRGYDWAAWHEISQASRPDASSPQAGHPDLLPLLKRDFDSDTAILTTEAWEKKRDAIRETLRAFLGEPETIPATEPGAEELGREDLGSYERIHLRILGEPDDAIPAYLLRPKQIGDSKVPVMIVLHQTQSAGKEESCGMTGDPEMAFAKELAERGILCIVPDVIGFGERIEKGGQPYDGIQAFFQKHPQWSCFGKMSWDLARVIDYIETLPAVDTARIGVIGHSHGAYGAIMGAVFEDRIRLVVASCGFTTLRADPRPERWSHLTPLLPRLGFYADSIADAPFDWHEIIACIAPRPYTNWATREDSIFPNTDNLASVYEQMTALYTLYDAGEDFAGKLAPGAHRFPSEAREAAYDWIVSQFRAAEGAP